MPARLKRLWASVAGDNVVPHRPTVAASFIVALLAVGVVLGLVAVSDPHDSAAGKLVPGAGTSTPAPSTTAPGTNITLVPAAPSPTTTAVVVAAPPTTSPGWCTPSDLRLSTSTNASSYPAGQVVDVTTDATDVVACMFQPETAPGASCPDSVVVEQSDGQVWPWPGQAEQCSPPAPTLLEPGNTESLAAAWDRLVRTPGGGVEPAPAGAYQAVGTWAWSPGPGQAPDREQATAVFSIS